MSIKMEESFRLIGTKDSLEFKILDNRLLCIYAPFLSSQWPLDTIGVQIMHQEENVKLGFMSTQTEAYQGWFLEVKEFERLVTYFRSLGYPVHGPDPFNFSKSVVDAKL